MYTSDLRLHCKSNAAIQSWTKPACTNRDINVAKGEECIGMRNV